MGCLRWTSLKDEEEGLRGAKEGETTETTGLGAMSSCLRTHTRLISRFFNVETK